MIGSLESIRRTAARMDEKAASDGTRVRTQNGAAALATFERRKESLVVDAAKPAVAERLDHSDDLDRPFGRPDGCPKPSRAPIGFAIAEIPFGEALVHNCRTGAEIQVVVGVPLIEVAPAEHRHAESLEETGADPIEVNRFRRSAGGCRTRS